METIVNYTLKQVEYSLNIKKIIKRMTKKIKMSEFFIQKSINSNLLQLMALKSFTQILLYKQNLVKESFITYQQNILK